MTFQQMQDALKEIVAAEVYRQQFNSISPLVQILPNEPEKLEYEVVWSGGELLPERESVGDDRLLYVPSLDEGEDRPTVKRVYNRTGNHSKKGINKDAGKDE